MDKLNDNFNCIRERNEEFKQLSPSERRVAIAKDVLKLIDAGLFTARRAFILMEEMLVVLL